MAKIFLLSEGDYSAYHIICAFSTREKAEEYLAGYNKHDSEDKAQIEEHDIDSPPQYFWFTSVTMDRDGNTKDVHICRGSSDTGRFYYFFGDGYMGWNVQTDDKERAIKVVNEKRAQILALGLWGNNQAVREQIK